MADPWTTPSARDRFYYVVFSPYNDARFLSDFNGLDRAIYRRRENYVGQPYFIDSRDIEMSKKRRGK
uniref:KTSC domain-containing protein n=1 Tax=Strongyloides papillosus TaxID=174720 RepID=A0A0N5CHI1_STREA